MINNSHDPLEHIKGLQQILVSDKKKIGFLFGAGTSVNPIKSKPNKVVILATDQMTTYVINATGKVNIKFEKALAEIKEELKIVHNQCDIESILSNIEQKIDVVGKGTLNGLVENELEELINLLKELVRNSVCVHDKLGESCGDLVHSDLAEWIDQIDRRFPIEIFTTNYDYLFELGLEYKDVAYYDGFTGSYKPFFYANSVEDFNFMPGQTKLWKIHGSLGWRFNKDTKKITRRYSPDENSIIIYPSALKYNESKKQPYISLMDRMSNFLKQDDSILITCGYSFTDQHINERILSALDSKAASHVIVLYFDDNLDEKHAVAKIAFSNSKISVYGPRSAIIGCKFGQWRLRAEPDKDDTMNINLYFDEDAPIKENEPLDQEKMGEEIWTGEGRFILARFSQLIVFLKSMQIMD